MPLDAVFLSACAVPPPPPALAGEEAVEALEGTADAGEAEGAEAGAEPPAKG